MEFVYYCISFIMAFYGGWRLKEEYDNRKKRKQIQNIIITTKCHDCDGTGYEDYDQKGDPLDFCTTCGGTGRLQIKQKDLY